MSSKHHQIRAKERQVLIVGLGWLGQALAKQLNSQEIACFGTVTSEQKRKSLHSSRCKVDTFNLYEDNLFAQSDDNLQTHDISQRHTTLVLNIPPGRKNADLTLYTACMMNLIDRCVDVDIKKIIFISTTSVYGALGGEVTNDTKRSPKTDSALAHVAIEDHLFDNYQSQSTVLRLSGLVGPKPDGSLRHPIFSLYKKDGIKNGRDPVNLVHQSDVIEAILRLIDQDFTSQAMLLSSIEHPSRQDYYTWCAEQLGLSKPRFSKNTENSPLGKVINAKRTYEELGFAPHYPSPFQMLQ